MVLRGNEGKERKGWNQELRIARCYPISVEHLVATTPPRADEKKVFDGWKYNYSLILK